MSKQLSPSVKIHLLLTALLFISIFCGTPLTYAANSEELPEPSLEDLRLKPVTLIEGKVGDLLRKWYAAGTAAGNVGDYYDNRDGRHSHLKMEDYPQLQKIKYSEEEKKQRRNYAAQRILLPYVVFGNSSTSAKLWNGGSNVRTYYTNPGGMNFLYGQYTHNNLYIYPAHHDYWQRDGHGDVLPINSPYLIAPFGSSGSDRKSMEAIAQTLAAFQPDVKKRLVETGLLMPTIQMILRYSAAGNWIDYLKGKAHRVAGIPFNNLKMIEMAHKLQINEIPPVVQLKVTEEDQPLNGEDFFSPGKSIKLADTPGVIARIFRGKSYWHRMVVSAESSFDLNNRDLAYHWKVLQGSHKKISIQPLNSTGSVVEIKIPFHERQLINKNGNMESNRVDIGVFVKGGKYYSAPGFITLFTLDNEARSYDDEEKILEIGYGMGRNVIEIADWSNFFNLISPETKSRPAGIMRSPFTRKEIDFLNSIADKYRKVDRAIEETKKELENNGKTDKSDLKKKLWKLENAKKELIAVKQQNQKYSINDLIIRRLNNLIDDPDFLNTHHADITQLFKATSDENKSVFIKEFNRLVNYGIIKKQQDYAIELTTVRKGDGPPAERLTRFEHGLIINLNATTMTSLVFPGVVKSSFQVNFVDQRLITPKFWRDVYHYSEDGQLTGWTRYSESGKMEFNPDGLIVLEKDGLGRCLKGQTAKYTQDRPETDKNGRRPWANTNPVKQAPGREIRYYKFADDSDWQGEVVKIEKK